MDELLTTLSDDPELTWRLLLAHHTQNWADPPGDWADAPPDLPHQVAAGPITLNDATEELDVAKATAHHHLSVLRQAGLVSIRGSGRTTRYALREDPRPLLATPWRPTSESSATSDRLAAPGGRRSGRYAACAPIDDARRRPGTWWAPRPSKPLRG